MRTVLVILLLLVFVLPVQAGTSIDTLGDFMQEVRWIVHCSNDDMLPDSVLIGFSQRSLLWTSADIGGIESTFLIKTAAAQKFYEIDSTITDILYATIIDDSETFSIKAFTPAFYEDAFNKQTTLQTGVGDQQPRAYNYWADTIQLIPTPINVDSVYFKCYVEHPECTAVGDSVELKSPYIEAAIKYCCILIYERWQEFEQAAYYQASYEALRVKLMERYRKRIEMVPQ